MCYHKPEEGFPLADCPWLVACRPVVGIERGDGDGVYAGDCDGDFYIEGVAEERCGYRDGRGDKGRSGGWWWES